MTDCISEHVPYACPHGHVCALVVVHTCLCIYANLTGAIKKVLKLRICDVVVSSVNCHHAETALIRPLGGILVHDAHGLHMIIFFLMFIYLVLFSFASLLSESTPTPFLWGTNNLTQKKQL